MKHALSALQDRTIDYEREVQHFQSLVHQAKYKLKQAKVALKAVKNITGDFGEEQ